MPSSAYLYLLEVQLLVIGIFMLGNKEALFKPTFTVKAYFHNVEGLRNGSPVKLSGIDAGAVQDIKVVGDTVSLIEVKMRLLEEISHFIRVDTQAEIQTEGLVGNKFVSLKIGDTNSELVKMAELFKQKNRLVLLI